LMSNFMFVECALFSSTTGTAAGPITSGRRFVERPT
jgi:hypothetical protein